MFALRFYWSLTYSISQKLKKEIHLFYMKKSSVVFSLLGLLVLPWLMQFQHVLAAHEHPTCEIADHHLHHADSDCDYPDYTLSPTFSVGSYTAVVLLPYVARHCRTYNAPSLSIFYTFERSLRGPPKRV
jgi:hypothetical protein